VNVIQEMRSATDSAVADGTTRVSLEQIARKLTAEGIFTGGPPQFFEAAGRLQMATLIKEGLKPDSKLLDIGCGCLRAGYWLVRFLDGGCYFGIEPNKAMLEKGIEHLLTPALQASKHPQFDTNDCFDFSVFGRKFDVFLARSIWSHASKPQIQAMLDSFVQTANPAAFFLTSYYPAVWWGRYRDYKGACWIGPSHQGSTPGNIHHSYRWIKQECGKRSLHIRKLTYGVFNGQHWLKIAKDAATLRAAAFSIR